MPLSDFQNVVFYPTRLIQFLSFEPQSSFTKALIKSYWGALHRGGSHFVHPESGG